MQSYGDVLTDWIVAQVSRLAPSPFSPEVQVVISRYAPTRPEGDRQFRELALVVGYSALMIPAIALFAFVGWTISKADRGASAVVGKVGWGLVVVLLAGVGLHLIRYYDALISNARSREGRVADRRSPRASSDLDLLVQIAAGVAAAILGPP